MLGVLRRSTVRGATLACTMLSTTSALADLPPPDDYVEQCTIDKAQERTGQACRSCNAWHGEPEACKTQFKDTTFAHECRAYGASTWSEVWCDPKAQLAAREGTKAPSGESAPPPAGTKGDAKACAIGTAPGGG